MKKVLIPSVVGILMLVYWRWHAAVPVLLTVEYHTLLKVKEKIQQQDPYYYSYYQRLIQDADRYMDQYTSAMEGEEAIASMHGLLNLHADGCAKADRISPMPVRNISVLIMAGFFSGQEKYDKQAAQLLRNLLVPDEDPVHRNLYLPSTVTEAGQLMGLLDVYPLLQQTSLWSDEDHAQMTRWAQQYLHLLLHDVYSVRDCHNDTTWYEAQVAVLAYFVHHDTLARQAVQSAKKLMNSQIGPDGRPLSGFDAQASSYCSIFNLQAFYLLSSVGERVGESLWRYTTPDGRSLQKASDYIFHTFLRMNESQQALKNERTLFSLLLKAQQVYRLREYEQYFNRLKRKVPGYWPVLLYSG